MSSILFRFHDLIGGIHVPIDDAVDKLNRKYTLLIFLFLALPIFTKQYIGEPIECFPPHYFTAAQARYVNSYCWTSSTYYIVAAEDDDAVNGVLDPIQKPLQPEEFNYGGLQVAAIGPDRLRRVRVGYYQWTALFLLVQGCCFHLPFVIWGAWAHNAGIKLRRLLKRASDISALPPGCQQREALLAEFVDQFHSLVSGNSGGCCDDPSCRIPVFCRCAGGPSRYLCVLYLVIKTLYVLNVGLQFILLTMFMGKGFLRHGFELLRRLLADGEWWNSPRFPLLTLCRMKAENQLSLQTYIFRCVLPINVFNEKIFSAVLFYLSFLLPLNILSLMLWIWRAFPWNRSAFVRLTLWRTRLFSAGEVNRVSRKLCLNHLGWDGIFVLRMIEHNHGSSTATLVMGKVWEFYASRAKMHDEATSMAGGGGEPEDTLLHGASSSTAPTASATSTAMVGGPSTSWHSGCACHVRPYGSQHHTMHAKRTPHDVFWEKCS